MNRMKIGLAGNPNVGKSTIFNALTGAKQHTGNWAGKTVENAVGYMKNTNNSCEIYDLPGIYSLLPHSFEEVLARDFLVFEKYDFVVVVCDASALLRNLNLVLQIKELNKKVLLCLNLVDEAKKKQIVINTDKLEKVLGVQVIKTCAHDRKSMKKLHDKIINFKDAGSEEKIKYPQLEKAIAKISSYLEEYQIGDLNRRWLALNILRNDRLVIKKMQELFGFRDDDENFVKMMASVWEELEQEKIFLHDIDDIIVTTINNRASLIYKACVRQKTENRKDKILDRVFTSKLLGIPIMLLFLGIIFLLTIKISNYPSEWLFSLFGKLEIILNDSLLNLGIPNTLIDLMVNGVYKVTTWVISVMLPPMMIFFPMFTLLEDFGYLPRIAFNMDGVFHKCSSCGKQALTMSMGFGCNCVGITGCRIIDSKRERLISILTNVFVPCNGKFPTIIAIISMFLVGLSSSLKDLFLSTGILLLVVLLGILMTFIVSKLLSMTLLKGYPSSFVLELTPYRRPRIIKTFITSILERTLFVLGRAVLVAMPAGFLIWLLANLKIGDLSVLKHLITFLDPFGKVFGLDGVIVVAFILGFPANEIIMPIMLMCYLNTGSLVDYNNLLELKTLLVDNGWTIWTAISVIILFVMHYPCSTACLTIKKETGSWYYVLLAMIIPTVIGLGLCFLLNIIF